MPLSFEGQLAAMGAAGSLTAFLLTGGCVGETRVIRASLETRKAAQRSTASVIITGREKRQKALPSPL